MFEKIYEPLNGTQKKGLKLKSLCFDIQKLKKKKRLIFFTLKDFYGQNLSEKFCEENFINNFFQYSRYRYLIQPHKKSSERIRIMDDARKTVDKLSNISRSEAFTVNDFFIVREGEKVSM